MFFAAPMIAGLIVLGQISAAESCSTIDTTIAGDSLQGLLNDGQKITVHLPACGKPRLYDYLLFTNAESKNAVVKQIWGMLGDNIEVTQKNGLLINNVEALNPFKRRYILRGFSKTRMKRLQGKPLEGYLVLGHSGSLDSSRIGVIKENNTLGFVRREQPYQVQPNQDK